MKFLLDHDVPEDLSYLLEQPSIGMAVRSGAAQPDIGAVEALKRTLLAAKSIGISDSASGVYLSTELFAKLGIDAQIAGRVRKIQADPVGEAVARGRRRDRLSADQ